MATFTSVQSGNWDNPATWGLTGTPTMGTNYPGAAGDVVNIGTTSGQSHVVVYDISNTNALGPSSGTGITVGSGTSTDTSALQFSTTVSTILTMGNCDIIVNMGGSLNVGTSGAVIPKTITAQLLWATTGNNQYGINNKGGFINFYGDPAYYGGAGNDKQILNATWSSGQTLTVTGSGAQSWNVGDCITVHKNAYYSNYNSDVGQFTIAAIAANGSNTNITIAQGAPAVTFKAGGYVNNVSRNVVCAKNGYGIGGTLPSIGSYITNQPRVTDSSAPGTYNINVCDSLWTGFQITFAYNANLLRNAVRFSNTYGINGGTGHTISSCGIYSNTYGINGGTGHTISSCGIYSNINGIYGGAGHTISSCSIYSNNYGINGGTGHTISSCGIYSNNYGITSGAGHTISSCSIYSNTQGTTGGAGHTISSCSIYSNTQGITNGNFMMAGGALGYNNGGTSAPNAYDIYGTSFIALSGVQTNVPITYSGRNSSGISPQRVTIEWYGLINSPTYNNIVQDAYGDIIQVPADGSGAEARPTQRSGGSPQIVEVVPQSNCSPACPLSIFAPPYESRPFRVWHSGDGVSHTYTFYLQATFAANLILTAQYLTGSVGGASGMVTVNSTTAVRNSNSDWSQSITATIPATTQDGWVTFNLTLANYVASTYLWIDPMWVKS